MRELENKVSELLANDKTGHNMDHVARVCKLALSFVGGESTNLEVVKLASMLHDVDDIKLFGEENARKLTNARRIMQELNISLSVQEQVIAIISNIGYKNCLKGKRPQTIEGMVVSDADMCDAIGVNGLLRVVAQSIEHNVPFFDKDIWPEPDKNQYVLADTYVCHMFEKLLKLKNIMMTESGKKEALSRHAFMVKFLKQLFIEEDRYDWLKFLEEYEKENHNLC